MMEIFNKIRNTPKYNNALSNICFIIIMIFCYHLNRLGLNESMENLYLFFVLYHFISISRSTRFVWLVWRILIIIVLGILSIMLMFPAIGNLLIHYYHN